MKVLQKGVSADLSNLKFMNSFTSDIFSIPGCRITRCGYTGEDGFEVSFAFSRFLNTQLYVWTKWLKCWTALPV